MVCNFLCIEGPIGEFQAFIIDFRSMTKHGNSVKPDISVHIAEAALSLAPY